MPTLPFGSAPMIRLDPQPTSSTAPWPAISSVMCLIALPLPVALQPDGAVVRAIVVVGGEDRVAQLPQRPERAHVVGADADERAW